MVIRIHKKKEKQEEAIDYNKIKNDLFKLLTIAKINKTVFYNLCETYKNKTVEVLKNDPYKPIKEIHGYGFKTAENIACDLNFKADDPRRINGGIRETLNNNVMYGDGSTSFYMVKAAKLVKRLLNDNKNFNPINDINSIYSIIEKNIEKKKLIEFSGRLSWFEVFFTEKRIKDLLLDKHEIMDIPQEYIDRIEFDKLANDQAQALSKILNYRFSILTGAPGTGKTYTINEALKAFDKQKIRLCAPTGKAAKRMEQMTSRKAYTIHKLLSEVAEFNNDKMVITGRKIDADIIIVDEASMLDVELTEKLLQSIKTETRLILVGDYNQLPSVGPGNVLKDIINSGVFPVAELKEIKRQALESDIVINCHQIKDGFPINFDNKKSKDFFIFHTNDPAKISDRIIDCMFKISEKYNYDLLRDIQILSPMRKRAGIGVNELNKRCQKEINKNYIDDGEEFYIDDKVIQTKNDYDHDIMNGDVGIITDIEEKPFKSQIKVSFDYPEREVELDKKINNLQLAYALTVHKSQGSEWPVVIIPIHRSFSFFFCRNLLYTAISRAKKMCVLVGDKNFINKIIENNKSEERNTNLEIFLKND